ncbi:uncharacterized protein [Onthophagus taurus]|uniref:uncharacterized protein n=1 Tax=Onthophagus taurus TaxID=166361 RepID=UPI000C1FDCDC|nr:uncharacterized protein LOC111418115 [Onthophagus taurus]
MFRVLCCGDSKAATIFRIAISQMVLYTVFIILYIVASFYTDNLNDEDDNPIIADRVLIIGAVLNVFPLLLAILLHFAIVKKNYEYVRAYILIKIFETIINTLILLGFSIYFALKMELYIALILCAIPIVIGIWMLECVVLVNVYYTSRTKPQEDNQKEIPENLPPINEEA